ncbi:MAG: S9 family peptidase [Planctomycetes bacterium]|nr:S9 family peptidase [Planctomycetota bacterium]
MAARPLISRLASAHLLAAACWALVSGAPCLAQGGSDRALTLDRLFSGELQTEGFGPAAWLADSGLATLERAQDGAGQDLVRLDPATGQRRVLVAARQLVPAGATRPLEIADYRFSADGTKVLIFTDTRRVWRQNTRGDYWVLDLESGALRQLGAGFEPTRLQFAKFDPQGERVAYLYRNDIYVEDLADRSIRRLTSDGSEVRTNGTFDWVYEEEWSLRDGFRWSPDGHRIAFWQIDASGVGEFSLIDNTSGLYPTITPIRYPKVGTRNPSCRIGVIAATGGEVRWMDLPAEALVGDCYVARMDWAASSDELVLQCFDRLQRRNDVTLADTTGGSTRVVLTDRGEAWVEECDDLQWFDDGRRFSFVSERDGWRHLYVVSRDGAEVRLVTRGDYDVVSIRHIDSASGFVYFVASPEDPTQRFLYRTRLDGTGAPERLTPQARGTHDYEIAPDGRHAVHTWSSFGVPPVVELVELPSHRVLRTLADNDRLLERLATLERAQQEFFRVDIGDSVELDGWVIRPPDFDPARRYPLLVHVYGEPAAQTVLDRWGGHNYLWHRMLAEQGYLVVSLDNRGTPAPRGAAWRKSIYRQIGIVAPSDQARALRALLERWSFVDPERIGVWGWSGGGSMSLHAIFRHPELYRCAIAIAFVADQRLYDTIYQERYMGLPADNVEGYRDGSPVTHAHRLQGDLLLVYGTGDDNCHYQNCEVLVNELIRTDRQFDMQIYPGRTHSIHEGPNTRRHLYTRMTGYLLEHLPAGAR